MDDDSTPEVSVLSVRKCMHESLADGHLRVERQVAWIAGLKPVPRVVLCVGPEIQQKALVKAGLGEPGIPDGQHGVVLVYDVGDRGQWAQGACFVGD